MVENVGGLLIVSDWSSKANRTRTVPSLRIVERRAYLQYEMRAQPVQKKVDVRSLERWWPNTVPLDVPQSPGELMPKPGEPKVIRRLFKKLRHAPRTPFPKPRRRIQAPNEHGVYIIYSPRASEVLHVGRTYRGKGGLRQ